MRTCDFAEGPLYPIDSESPLSSSSSLPQCSPQPEEGRRNRSILKRDAKRNDSSFFVSYTTQDYNGEKSVFIGITLISVHPTITMFPPLWLLSECLKPQLPQCDGRLTLGWLNFV